ncbi:MAG: rhomboid family intramembrane serine protease [Sphingobacteriales bacterium]|nr:rhomboid family intramembrane serine protease [Sphingobacteriales bacterium]MBP8192899.1 rhomboid family intramembrane serine protease [Chitinophagales bacterium]
MNIWQDIKWQYRYGSDLIKLILINIAVFITVNLINIPFILFAKTVPFNLVDFLSLYASPHNFVRHPWGIFTYMFIHEGFWHILWNMLGLYWFGQIVQDMIGKPKILPLYIFGGIFGGLLYMLAYNIFPLFSNAVAVSSCIGASAGVMAIVLAAATIAPNFELGFAIIGPVKIKWIALVYVVLDLINIQGGNAGGHIAHLGGALFGFVFIKQLQSGNDFTRPFYAVTDFFSNLFKKKSNLKVEYKKEYVYTSEKNTKSNTAQQKETISKQEKLDAILDKINRSSYDSLSKEEKEFLFKISQED